MSQNKSLIQACQKTSMARYVNKHKWFFDANWIRPSLAVLCWMLLLFPMMLLPHTARMIGFYIWLGLLCILWVFIYIALLGSDEDVK